MEAGMAVMFHVSGIWCLSNCNVLIEHKNLTNAQTDTDVLWEFLTTDLGI